MTPKVVEVNEEDMPEEKPMPEYDERESIPMVSWTVKLVHPDSSEPDFIRIEAWDVEVVRSTVVDLRRELRSQGWREVGQGVKNVPETPKDQPRLIEPEDEFTMAIRECTIERDLKGKYVVKLYTKGSDQQQHPNLQMHRPKWEDIEAVIPVGLPGVEELPFRLKPISWKARWEPSKKLNPYNNKPYKNVVSITKED